MARTFIYVVAQETPHGAMVDSDKCYQDYELAKQVLEYYHKEKMDWMKMYTLRVEDKIPEYMERKLKEIEVK